MLGNEVALFEFINQRLDLQARRMEQLGLKDLPPVNKAIS
jgi:hypothetical protein